MQLFLLKRVNGIDYDECDGFVVRAKDENAARILASANAGGEGSDIWMSDTFSTCSAINGRGVAGIILRSFNAG